MCCENPTWIREQFLYIGMNATAGGGRPKPSAGVKENQQKLWSLVEECWCDFAHFRPNFDEIIEELEDIHVSESTTTSEQRVFKSAFLSTEDAAHIRAHFNNSSKTYSAFLSHHKESCAAEARLLKEHIDSLASKNAFLGECVLPLLSPSRHC